MVAPEVEAFSKLLAAADPDERQRLLQQANMLALAGMPTEAVDPPPIRTLAEYLATPIEVPPRLVEPGLVVRGGIFCLTGLSGSGKSTLLFNGVLSWASGRPLFSTLPGVLAPTQPLRTLVIENEGAPGEFHRNIGVMLERGLLTDEQKAAARENVLIWGDGGWSGLKLDQGDCLDRLRRGIEAHKPDVIFLEPFVGLWSGEENSATEMRNVLDTMQELANTYEAGIVISHHERKAHEEGQDDQYAARGSTALAGAVTAMSRHRAVKSDRLREWSVSKSRYEPKPDNVRLEYIESAHWYKPVADNELRNELMAALRADGRPEVATDELAGDVSETIAATAKALRELKKEKLVANGNAKGTWRLVSDNHDRGVTF